MGFPKSFIHRKINLKFKEQLNLTTRLLRWDFLWVDDIVYELNN